MVDAHQLSNEASCLIAQGKYKQGMVNLVPALRLARQLGATAEIAAAATNRNAESFSTTTTTSTSSREASTVQLSFSSSNESCNNQEINTSDPSSSTRTSSASADDDDDEDSSPFLGNVFQLPLFVQMKTTTIISESVHVQTADDIAALTAPTSLAHDDLGSFQESSTNNNAADTSLSSPAPTAHLNASPTADDVKLLTLTIIYNLALSMHLQALGENDGINPIDRTLGQKTLALYQHAHALLFRGMLTTKWNETKTSTVLGLALMVNAASISRMLGMDDDAMGSYHRAFSMLLWAERHSDSQDVHHAHDCTHMNGMYRSYLDVFYSHLIGQLAGGGRCAACA